jgi:hypothetical protein
MDRRKAKFPEVGEWVEAYAPGIWRVVSVLSGFFKLRDSLQEPKKIDKAVRVFAKRLVDDKWRKSFRIEMCDSGLVHGLSNQQQAKLTAYINDNPNVTAEFEAYKPELPGFGTAVGFNLSHMPDFAERLALIDTVFAGVDRGLTKDDILERIATSSLALCTSSAPKNTTVLFGNIGHELRNGDFVFRSYIVQPF